MRPGLLLTEKDFIRLLHPARRPEESRKEYVERRDKAQEMTQIVRLFWDSSRRGTYRRGMA